MSVSLEQLTKLMPRLKVDRATSFLSFLNAAMAEAGINTPIRIAAFLAQLAHESGELRYWEEIWGPTTAQKGYEGRADLGNVQPGDGYRYRGRAPIQLTGRKNYQKYGALLGVDLEKQPELASMPDIGFRIASTYWKTSGLNILADQIPSDPAAFDRVTRRINGGLNGKADRDQYFATARKLLGT